MRVSASTFLSITRIDCPARLEPRQALPDLGADQRRQAFGRLVEDQQPRIGHQRAADRQHLLLAAGQKIAHAAEPLGEPREQVADPVERPGLGGVGAVGGGRDQVLARGQVGENLPPLRHQADAELGHPIGRQAADLAAGEADRAGPRRRQPHDRAHGGGLAHAVAAHQRHHLAGRDGERQAEQHLAQAVAGLDVVDLEQLSTGRLLLAEIGRPHLGVGADVGGRARGDHPAIDQHGDAVGEREHRLHVVLDQQDGELPLQGAQHLRPCGRIPPAPGPPSARRAAACAGCRQAPWPARAGDARRGSSGRPAYRPALPGRRARAPRAPARAVRGSRRASRQNRNEWPACACTASATLSSAVKSRNSDVIWNERASPSMLRRCAGSAVMSAPVERDAAGVGRDLAGKLADQRGLAGAVRADDGVQAAPA